MSESGDKGVIKAQGPLEVNASPDGDQHRCVCGPREGTALSTLFFLPKEMFSEVDIQTISKFSLEQHKKPRADRGERAALSHWGFSQFPVGTEELLILLF